MVWSQFSTFKVVNVRSFTPHLNYDLGFLPSHQFELNYSLIPVRLQLSLEADL